MPPPRNRLLLRLLRRLHYDHHVVPHDQSLYFLPAWYSLPNILLSVLLFQALLRDLPATAAFGAGLLAVLLFYEWSHYAAHKVDRPVTRWGRRMKQRHLWHHFRNERYWFGVSNAFHDRLFGTLADPGRVARSPTAGDLEKQI